MVIVEFAWTNLANVNILHLTESALQSTAAGSIHAVTETVHSLHKQGQATRVGRGLATQECLFGHSTGELAGNEEVGLAAELFNEFMGWGSVEDVVLDRNILVIKLLQNAQGRNVGGPVTKACVAELVCDSL